MIVCFLWWCSDGNRTCVDSVSKKKEPKWLVFRRDTPQSKEFQKQVKLALETTDAH